MIFTFVVHFYETMIIDFDKLVKLRDWARLVGVSHRGACNWIKDGKVRSYRIGKAHLILNDTPAPENWGSNGRKKFLSGSGGSKVLPGEVLKGKKK